LVPNADPAVPAIKRLAVREDGEVVWQEDVVRVGGSGLPPRAIGAIR